MDTSFCRRAGRLAGLAFGAMIVSSSVMARADQLTHGEYGTLPNGGTVDEFTMTNVHGITVKFLSLGGCITEIDVPDRNGKPGNIVLGHANLAGYDSNKGYFGAIVGRYANRIAGVFLRSTATPIICRSTTVRIPCMAEPMVSTCKSGMSPRKRSRMASPRF